MNIMFAKAPVVMCPSSLTMIEERLLTPIRSERLVEHLAEAHAAQAKDGAVSCVVGGVQEVWFRKNDSNYTTKEQLKESFASISSKYEHIGVYIQWRRGMDNRLQQ